MLKLQHSPSPHATPTVQGGNSHAEAINSPVGSQLVGKSILFKWPPRLGGWLVGKIEEANSNLGQDNDEAFAYNFKVAYAGEDERASHMLSVESYAHVASAKTDSWVLLG